LTFGARQPPPQQARHPVDEITLKPLELIDRIAALVWDGCDAQIGEGVEVEPDWDEADQLAPDFEADQRVSW
jgi:hypothetical protein